MALPADFVVTHDCEVWPDHWVVLEVFLLCHDQLRVADDRFLGIDLGVVLGVMSAYAVRNKRQFLEDLQVVARHAVELINKERRQG